MATVQTAAADAAGHPCAGVPQAEARLACYDRAFPPAVGADTSIMDLEDRRQQGLRDFGLSRQQMREQDPERMNIDAPDRVQARIVRVGAAAEGRRTVTLDNDQMWLLTESTSRGRLEPGAPVVVREAALGSFMLVTESGVALRARRIR